MKNTSKMSELYPSQIIIGFSGTRYLVVDNSPLGILTLLRPFDDNIFEVDWLQGTNHVVKVISSNHSVCFHRLPKKDIPTLPDNFNEFLAMIGA